MSAITSCRDLMVWQLGMQGTRDCYLLTRSFPKEEMFGMTNQIRKSVASIPANIAEGYGRESRGEYLQFLRIAQGSLKELETHLLLSTDVGLSQSTAAQPVLQVGDQIGRLLHSLIRKLQSSH